MHVDELIRLEPSTLRCPWPLYDRFRERGVFYAPEIDAWVVSRHADVVAVLRDGRTFSSVITVGNPRPGPGDDEATRYSPLLLLSDDPEHARRRKIVNRAFTPSQLKAWEPLIGEVCTAYADALLGRDEVDLVAEFAVPLPIRIITSILGVPQEHVDTFRGFSEEITAALGGHNVDPERRLATSRAFAGYITELLELRMREPAGDLLTVIAEQVASGELTLGQGARFVMELLVAGNITTTHHLASSLLVLARDPELWQRLRDDASLVPRFVEESLRLESPIQGFYRLVTEDTVVGGEQIPADARVFVLYGSANRDDDAWPQCPQVDLDRPNLSAHLAFGRGAHACIGSSLARAESRIALEALLARVDRLELVGTVEEIPYLQSFINHGPLSVPVRLQPRA
jgi:cytochrome P450